MSTVNTDADLSIEQEHAVILCCDLSQEIASVTGGAGTGKTLVLGKVYEELKRRNRLVALCAPTGRAAKRIEELTGIKAKTCHRLLEFPKPDDDDIDSVNINEPKRNKSNPFRERIIIVDESSMLSPTLFQQLIDALPRGGIIRFFGDNNQLPPVEEGAPPFISLLKTHPKVELTFNFRSDDVLVSNAQRILKGLVPARHARFEIVYTDYPISTLIDFATPACMEDDIQIIMPTRRGSSGTMRVNPSLQQRFNKEKTSLKLDRFDEKEAKLFLKPGDKFLWTKNDYKLEMFNGEIGTVDWIDDEDGSVGLLSGDREVEVPAQISTYSPWHRSIIQYDPRRQIDLGYAITTHKSQGSEFKTIVYCMTRAHFYLLDRRNFYTAVTRAKGNVILITDRAGMGLSLRKSDV